MAFILSYGNTWLGAYKTDVAVGYMTPKATEVNAGQVGSELYTLNRSENSRVYAKLGLGYNLSSVSSVDADYSLIVMPGLKWEQSIGSIENSEDYKGNIQSLINIGYSRTINFAGDKVSLGVKPNVNFDILTENDVLETESVKTDNGKRNTLRIIPTVAIGVRYRPTTKLSLYTGTTITLFDAAFRSTVKGADGAAWGDGDSQSGIVSGAQTGMDLGAVLALTENFSVDFNVRQLLSGTFWQSAAVDLFLSFKK